MSLTREKLRQASQLMAKYDLDVWITFVRETFGGGDPVLPLIFEGGLTWQSALMVFRDGAKVAVVGNYDADPLRASGEWDEVIPYVQSIRERLEERLRASNVRRVGANFSVNDVKADGLTHGMYRLLEQIVQSADAELVTAEGLVGELRGRKSPEEVRRIKAAIAEADYLFDFISDCARRGVTERAVFQCVHEEMADRNLGYAWDPAGNPIVNSGPHSMIGHGIASPKITIEPGHVFHVDLGVVKDGYSSDLQRSWYVGDSVPEDVRRAFDAVNATISAGAGALRPGVAGWEVDAVARETIASHGFEVYLHALGHQVGRVAHDGGGILGPRWERYGDTPYRKVMEDEIYTLELGVTLPTRGYLGLEEMVRVTKDGVEWLSNRQLELPLIKS
jgi:Xaa-Pro aminopeptidase